MAGVVMGALVGGASAVGGAVASGTGSVAGFVGGYVLGGVENVKAVGAAWWGNRTSGGPSSSAYGRGDKDGKVSAQEDRGGSVNSSASRAAVEALGSAVYAGASRVRNATGVWWNAAVNLTTARQGKERVSVRTVAEFDALLAAGVSIDDIDVRGRSQPWRQNERGEAVAARPATPGAHAGGNLSVLDLRSEEMAHDAGPRRGDGRSRQLQHPVLRAIWERKKAGSKPGARADKYKIALAIEGGGLRGSVTAGMSAAVMHLGIDDCFDMVLGSSAGSIIGTYLLANDDPTAHREGTYEFFCKHLTMSRERLNGSSWLDMGRLVDLFTPSVPFTSGGAGRGAVGRGMKKEPAGGDANTKPRFAMMALDYPMKTIMQELQPVDWDKFARRDAVQPLKIIASGLFSKRAVMLGSEEGSFADLPSLCEAVKASCMLPGVAGVEPQWLKGSSARTPEVIQQGLDEFLRQEVAADGLWGRARNAFEKQMRARRGDAGARPSIPDLQRLWIQSADARGNFTEMPGRVSTFAALAPVPRISWMHRKALMALVHVCVYTHTHTHLHT